MNSKLDELIMREVAKLYPHIIVVDGHHYIRAKRVHHKIRKIIKIALSQLTMNKQQLVADKLYELKDAFIVGIINEYELAGKLLNAVREAEVNEMAKDLCVGCTRSLKLPGERFCLNCLAFEMSDAQPQGYEEVKNGQSESEAYRNAHS